MEGVQYSAGYKKCKAVKCDVIKCYEYVYVVTIVILLTILIVCN